MNEDIKDIEPIESIDESSGDITNPFDPTKIDIIYKPLNIDLLIKRMNSNPMRIDLNTEFQRRGNLWTEKEQSRLIESILVRIPLPAFYFDGSNDNNWLVVDGLQRLYTIKNFVIDQSLKLKDLEYLKEHEGKFYNDLPLFLKTRIEETQINAYIINPGTPPQVKYTIFRRINTGGLTLKPQEIRNALNQGIPATFINELAELEDFQRSTSYSLIYHPRMEDKDFVTRFVGFYNGYENYKSDLDEFLNDAMANLGKITEKERQKIKEDFIKATYAAVAIFGDDAFRKRYNVDYGRKPLNKALFDSWSVNLAKLSKSDLQILISKRDNVKEKFMNLLNNNQEFEKAISSGTGDLKAVRIRFSKIKDLLDEVLNDKTD